MQVNLGGDRIGSGARMQQDMHNYGRSTFNLSKKFRSSLAPGVLIPAYVNVGLPGDKFEININEITRTIPTRGPLFGSYKMQIDFFIAPMRLYNGVLHNNPVNIGLNMKNVKLPVISLYKQDSQPVNPTNIWKYLGLSGLGLMESDEGIRMLNATPLLAYYDIFKNYYANKQEEYFYFLDKIKAIESSTITTVAMCSKANNACTSIGQYPITYTPDKYLLITGKNIYKNGILNISIVNNDGYEISQYADVLQTGSDTIRLTWNTQYSIAAIKGVETDGTELKLEKEKLETLDDVREKLLNIGIGQTLDIISLGNICKLFKDWGNEDKLKYPMTGLVCKTYQSDLYNNWLKTETIDGENGIREITKVDTSNGLEMDALNLAQKVYNMLNRIAIGGGTYQDYIEAVYSHETYKFNETPMYVGGYSAEIMFEEVVQTAPTDTSKNSVLGALGGRGKHVMEKGGYVDFEITEPAIIMAMVSLTPRINYSQGNKWYLTDVFSIDDLHKPALDGIGFQDLLVEQMCYTGTKINGDQISERLSAGKTVAWANYMTDVDECFGDMANEESYAYMVLNRNYNNRDANGQYITPTDVTTYIDPAKYNYAFAVAERQAQNFWTEIQFDIKARRIMSAKQIPNL